MRGTLHPRLCTSCLAVCHVPPNDVNCNARYAEAFSPASLLCKTAAVYSLSGLSPENIVCVDTAVGLKC